LNFYPALTHPIALALSMLYNGSMDSNGYMDNSHAFGIAIVFFVVIFAVRLWNGPAKKGTQRSGPDFGGAGGDGCGLGGGHGDCGDGDGGGGCH
jgi:hypothetical protein